MIARLPDAELFDNFAYQIELLKQFEGATQKKRGSFRRSASVVENKTNNSVHGYKVFDRSKSMNKGLKRSTSGGNLNGTVGKSSPY